MKVRFVIAALLSAVIHTGAESAIGYANGVLMSSKGCNAADGGQKPNIVFMLADDLGYGDLGCFGSKACASPVLDKLAMEGLKLTSFYVSPLCTPTRASLMTGCYPARVGLGKGSRHAVLLDADTNGLNPDEITVAEVLKSAGYVTGMFGKWHLGDQPEFMPPRQGFDEFFGTPYSWDVNPTHMSNHKLNFPPLPLLDGEKVIEQSPDRGKLTQRITERAVQFIHKNKDKPFFLYFPHFLPHRPLYVGDRFKATISDDLRRTLEADDGSKDRLYRDALYPQAVAEIDWAAGEIMKALKESGLDHNTLVIFVSDNGPAVGTAEPLRGRKGEVLEGGIRVPAIAWWPGRIPVGTRFDEPVGIMDLLPTFAEIAGAKVPSDRVIDGKSILACLTAPQNAHTPHEAVYAYSNGRLATIIAGAWKLHLLDHKLYDLSSDITESRNVAKAHPEVVSRLKKCAQTFTLDMEKHSRSVGKVDNPVPLTIKEFSKEYTVEDLKKLPIVKFTYSPAEGLGPEKGVCRRDNSDVIKVGDTYYVWYSKVKNEPGVFNYPGGYSATIWYAVSKDGLTWVEKGEALGKGGAGAWDEEGVYTPGILVADGKYYLGYDGANRPWTNESPAHEGLAIADSPDGPWVKLAGNPINNPTEAKFETNDPRNFDSFRVCDVCLLVRDGKYWWYYKGRGKNLTPAQTKLGVSIAEKPEGPYIKHRGNPLVFGGHEVLAWPHGKGVAVLIGYVGPEQVRNTIQYADDGIHFRPVARVINPPAAPGGYRPDAFTQAKDAQPMKWGISMKKCGNDICLERFDCDVSGILNGARF